MRNFLKLLPLVLLMGAATLWGATELTTEQQKALDYLTENWGVNMNVSGIDLAMDALGGGYTEEDRYTLGVYIRDHPEVHQVRRRFGWETIALSPSEKRIAVVLSRAEREGQHAPSVEDLTQLLGLPRKQIEAGLSMLQRFEIIQPAQGASGVAYRMSKPRYVNWEGGMKITFTSHRAEVQGVGLLDTY